MTYYYPKHRYNCRTEDENFKKNFKINLYTQDVEGEMRTAWFLDKLETVYLTQYFYDTLVGYILDKDIKQMEENFGMQELQYGTRLSLEVEDTSPEKKGIKWYTFKGEIDGSISTAVSLNSRNHTNKGFNLAYQFIDPDSSMVAFIEPEPRGEVLHRSQEFAINFHVKCGNSNSIDNIDSFLKMIALKVRQAKQNNPQHVRNTFNEYDEVHSIIYKISSCKYDFVKRRNDIIQHEVEFFAVKRVY